MTSSTLASADRARIRSVAIPSREVALGSALLAAAVVLGLVEASIPGIPIAPWLKLGLANAAVVVALVASGTRMAAVVSIGRVGIVGLATGSLGTPVFAMALAGALAALAVMSVAHHSMRGLSTVGLSAIGSAGHVVAQFLAAGYLLHSWSLLGLLPPSVIIALAVGAFVGYLARIAVSRLSLG